MSTKRLAELTIAYNRLQSTLKGVAAQRDALAAALLNVAHYAEGVDYGTAVTTILTDLVESGNVVDHHGFLS